MVYRGTRFDQNVRDRVLGAHLHDRMRRRICPEKCFWAALFLFVRSALFCLSGLACFFLSGRACQDLFVLSDLFLLSGLTCFFYPVWFVLSGRACFFCPVGLVFV